MLDIPADIIHVTDGDTIQVHAYPWPGTTITTGVRVRGVDTPEINTKCLSEKKAGLIAKTATQGFLNNTRITLKNVIHDKYGRRVVADIITEEGSSLAEFLISNGLGSPNPTEFCNE